MLFDSLIGEQHVLLNLHFETRIAFDKECCFLQEIYKRRLYIMRSDNFEKRGKTKIFL